MTVQEFCLHYPEWCYLCDSVKLNGGIGSVRSEPEWKDTTCDIAHIWEYSKLYVSIIEESCKDTNVLLVITEDIPPEMLGVSEDVVNSTYAIIARRMKKWILLD